MVTTDRKIYFNFLEKMDLGLVRKLKKWANLLSYPNFVKEFFSNMKLGIGCIEYDVKWVQIVLDIERLDQILKVHVIGNLDDHLEHKSSLQVLQVERI